MKIEPLARRYRTFFVGLFVLIPVLAIPSLLLYTFLKSDLWQGVVTLYVMYDNSYGLKKGNQVTISGTTVGYVQDVELLINRMVLVRFDLREQYLPLVKKDTRAYMKQKSFVVGDWEIELLGGSEGFGEVENGDTLQSQYPRKLYETLDQVTGMVSAAEKILQLIISGQGTVGRLLTEDSLYQQLGNIASSVESLSRNAGGAIMSADSLFHSFQGTAQSSTELIDSLGIILAAVKNTLEETHKIVENVKVVSGDAPAIVGRLEDNLSEVELMMRALQKNWLLRKFMGEQPDPLLIDNP